MNTRKETCNAGSRIDFRGLNLKIFSLTTFQEREYELHFTDIQPTFRLFPWGGFICSPLPELEHLVENSFHGLFSEKETSGGTPGGFVVEISIAS